MRARRYDWRFSTRVALPMAVVTLVSIALTFLGLLWAADRSDAISIERQVRVAKRAVSASVDAVAAAQEPLAVWDDAVDKTTGALDPEWFRGGFVSFFDGMWPGGQVYIVNGRDQAVYASIGPDLVATGRFEKLRPHVTGMLDELRGRVLPRAHPHDRLVGGPNPPKRAGTLGRVDYVTYVAHLKRIDGRPAVVSIMRIIPVNSRVEQWRGREPALINVRYLDAAFLAELAERNLLDRPRFGTDHAPDEGEVGIPLVSEDGGVVAHLLWSPERPGTRILGKLAPLAALSALITAAACFWLVRSLRHATRELQAREAEAAHDACHDGLTGLPNRALFAHRLDAALDVAPREHGALLLLDLDRFKAVNDTMGHAAGDALLKEFGRRLDELVGPGDTVARFGGDEFGIVLRHVDAAAVEAMCACVLEATHRPFGLAEGVAHVGVSIGVALLTEPGLERGEILRAADRALYLAKASGRDTFTIFRADPEAGSRTVAELRAEAERRVA